MDRRPGDPVPASRMSVWSLVQTGSLTGPRTQTRQQIYNRMKVINTQWPSQSQTCPPDWSAVAEIWILILIENPHRNRQLVFELLKCAIINVLRVFPPSGFTLHSSIPDFMTPAAAAARRLQPAGRDAGGQTDGMKWEMEDIMKERQKEGEREAEGWRELWEIFTE